MLWNISGTTNIYLEGCLSKSLLEQAKERIVGPNKSMFSSRNNVLKCLGLSISPQKLNSWRMLCIIYYLLITVEHRVRTVETQDSELGVQKQFHLVVAQRQQKQLLLDPLTRSCQNVGAPSLGFLLLVKRRGWGGPWH